MTRDQRPIADQVIIAVFDGLRPDMVTPELTPGIVRLAARGAWFREARSVFPSVTRVATSSIATGAPPSLHGIVGNSFYHPAAMPDGIFDTGKAEHIRRVEAHADGRFVAIDTFGDQLARTGRRLAVVHTGSAGASHFINPRARANSQWTFSMHGPQATQTPHAIAEAIAQVGPLPERSLPKTAEMAYGGRVMTDYVLPVLAPDVALIWFSEPDTTFHYKGLGSPEAKAGLAAADAALETILDWVGAQPSAERIAVIAASDHGHVSTSAIQPLFDDARRAGFALGQRDQLQDAAFIATGGRSGEIRHLNDDPAALGRIAAWLMEQPTVGHVFSRGRNEVDGEIPGTLSLALMGNGHDRQPDLMFVLASDLGTDPFGLPGLGIMTPGDVPLGGGMHGGINRHELNTVLILGADHATAPRGILRDPAGIIDIAPTVLGMLGVPPAATMQGRNLALPARDAATVTRRSAGSGGFSQHVDFIEQDGRRFILGGGP